MAFGWNDNRLRSVLTRHSHESHPAQDTTFSRWSHIAVAWKPCVVGKALICIQHLIPRESDSQDSITSPQLALLVLLTIDVVITGQLFPRLTEFNVQCMYMSAGRFSCEECFNCRLRIPFPHPEHLCNQFVLPSVLTALSNAPMLTGQIEG